MHHSCAPYCFTYITLDSAAYICATGQKPIIGATRLVQIESVHWDEATF
jgi:hypothetical protein